MSWGTKFFFFFFLHMDIYLLQCFLLNSLFFPCCLGTSVENKLPINVRLFLDKKILLHWSKCLPLCKWVGKIPWRRERLPTPVFWPGEFHGLYSPWGHKELDMTEQLSLHFMQVECSFDICSFAAIFIIWKWDFPSLLFLLIGLLFQSTLQCYMNFRISFQISIDKPAAILTKIVFNL